MSFINRDNTLFWIDEKYIYSHELANHKLNKVHRLNGAGKSLAIDWVSRHIYWSESDTATSQSFVYKLDLNNKDKGQVPQFVLRDNNTARLVEIDPFTR